MSFSRQLFIFIMIIFMVLLFSAYDQLMQGNTPHKTDQKNEIPQD